MRRDIEHDEDGRLSFLSPKLKTKDTAAVSKAKIKIRGENISNLIPKFMIDAAPH